MFIILNCRKYKGKSSVLKTPKNLRRPQKEKATRRLHRKSPNEYELYGREIVLVSSQWADSPESWFCWCLSLMTAYRLFFQKSFKIVWFLL
jgi:hypothetical protein